MLSFVRERCIWETLQEERRPVVLYGMGDGALKVLAACRLYGIPVRGIFVSDDRLRRRDFAGFPLKTLAELESELGEMVVLLCFAAFRPELIAQILRVGERHRLLVPDLPVFGDGLFDTAFLEAHAAEFDEAYRLLADEQSRAVFRAVVNFKLSGEPSYLAPVETPREEMYRLLRIGPDEDYVDLGGYDGDTAEEFLGFTGGRYSSMTILEPDEKNFRKLERRAAAFPPGDVRLIQAACWQEDGTLSFQSLAGRNSFLDAGGRTEVAARSVDSLSAGRRVSFLKMDVEGVEREALLGARETIRRDAPALLAAAYHRREDLFALPLLVRRLGPDYRIFLRRQTYLPAWETNLCARR